MRVVLKIGSAVLMREGAIQEVVEDTCRLMGEHTEVVIVTSGAIAQARTMLDQVNEHSGDLQKQVLAAVGQPMLMKRYVECFATSRSGPVYHCSQHLLTSDDLRGERREVTKEVIMTLLRLRVAVIINENDVVTVEGVEGLDEWWFCENDRLARLITELIDADMTIIGIDEPGVLDHPGYPGAQVVPELYESDVVVIGQQNIDGRGGMDAKRQAGFEIANMGKVVYIADPRGGNFYRLVHGSGLGTRLIVN